MSPFYTAVILALACQLVASDTETNVWENAKKSIDELTKITGVDQMDHEKVKKIVDEGIQNMKTQMEQVTDKLQEQIKNNPDSGLGKIYNDLKKAVDDFKSKNPDMVEGADNFHKATAATANKIVEKLHEARDEMNKEGGLADQMKGIMENAVKSMQESSAKWSQTLSELSKN